MPYETPYIPPRSHPWKRERTIPPTFDANTIAVDGEVVSAPLMFMDSVQKAVHEAAHTEVITDNGQSAYEARIANAWRDGGNPSEPPAKAVTGATVRDNGQAEYEARIRNAWRATQ